MTELETMQRAKLYLDKLAQGIDPITNQEIPEDSVLNNVRLARCFFYVSDILGRVIANEGYIGSKPELLPFRISTERMRQVPLSVEPVRITQLLDRIYETANDSKMKKPSASSVSNWLLAKGFLEKQLQPDGKSRRVPSASGRMIGMSQQLRQGMHGEYLAVVYDLDAQRFVLDHLMEMIAGSCGQEDGK